MLHRLNHVTVNYLKTNSSKRHWENSGEKFSHCNCVATSSELKHPLLEVGGEALTINSC